MRDVADSRPSGVFRVVRGSGIATVSRVVGMASVCASLMLSSLPIAEAKARRQTPSAASSSAGGKVASASESASPVRAPSAKQLAGFRQLASEAEVYTKAAHEYQRLLTVIVKHHFEERRRQVVENLDKEIEVEKEELEAAREITIKRLVAFIDKYSGANAHPQSTPDAMYRLAALYEERARADFDTPLSRSLLPAIALYLRVIEQFPSYKEIAGVHYYLGHAQNDAGEIDQAQQAWRALVCHNRYPLTVKQGALVASPMPQDHDDEFWNQWYNKNPIPLDQLSPGERSTAGGAIGVKQEELVYDDPYRECEPLPQEVEEGEEPRYVAEVWWQLGNYHFDHLDNAGGPYALNRAASAYQWSLKYKKPPLYGVSLYKNAWTQFKQQRYAAAVRWFVDLLRHADKMEEETGDPGADFRAEAYTYIAGSLTYVDFKGPAPEDPYIPRNDVLDLETDPLVAEEKMGIALGRVQDPKIIPQDQPWTVEIYKALAEEYVQLNQLRNAVLALNLTLERFGLDREAPKLQAKVAELHEELARLAPEGSPVKDEHAAAALAARTKLTKFVGDSPWARANKDDPEALQEAETLVREGLKRAAADHTNFARAFEARANELTDSTAKQRLLERAVKEYRDAARGWAAYIDQNPNAVDVYESRFWLADASYWSVALQVDLKRTPSEEEVKAAVRAAAAVRDSNEDDKFQQPAAYYVVAIADRVLEDQHRVFEESGGARGVRRRETVEFSQEGDEQQVVKTAVPKEVRGAALARDDYNRRIDYRTDPEHNGLLYAFQAADMFFVYGDFKQARLRFKPLMDMYCGKNEWGYKAWEKLISMSNFEGDAKQSRALAEGRSCAFDEETRAAENAIRTPVRQGVAFLDARALYDAAEKLPEGPERDAQWRAAAAAYKEALDAAPDRDEAPEAAMNGAFAYKQVGDYDKAIDMYELFISRYGSTKNLSALKEGNPDADPPVKASPKKYETRVKFLKMAYDALANANVLFFDYPRAARTFDTISGVEHFSAAERRESAQQALSLYTSLGDKEGMQRAHRAFLALGAEASDRAEADFVLASAPLKRWDQFSPDKGANARARAAAQAAMQRYYQDNVANPEAAKFVVEAAYWVAKMKGAAGEADTGWWENAIAAFGALKAQAPKNADGTSSALATREAAMAAEGAFTLLDRKIKKLFDYESGHHRFKGTPQEVLKQYSEDAKEAKIWLDRLQDVVDSYAAPEWAAAAVARQGSLYDSLRSGLFNVRPPELMMFDKATEKKLRLAEQSDNLDLQEKADAIRISVENGWRDRRDRELASADQVMVDRYGTAITLARRYNVTSPAVVRAIQRLAFFTDVIGEAKLQSYTSRIADLNYQEGMFLRIRPGLVTAPKPSGLPAATPLSAGAAR